MKNKQTDQILKIKTGAACWLAGVTGLLVPLYIRKGYFGLIEEKARVCLALVLPGLLAAGAAGIWAALKRGNGRSGPDRADHISQASGEKEGIVKGGRGLPGGKMPLSKRWKEHGTGLILLCVAAWPLVSSCLSPDALSSFLGTVGWSMGSLMQCAMIGCTACVCAWFPLRADNGGQREQRGQRGQKSQRGLPAAGKKETGGLPGKAASAVLAVHALIFLFALLQEAGVDLFGFLTGIDQFYVYSYLSTIGQKNSFAGYMCLILPVFLGLFMETREKGQSVLYGAFCTLGLLCACLADSDSFYAGMGICLLFLLPFALADRRRTERAAILLVLFGGCLLAAGRLPMFADRAAQIQDISAFMLTLPCALAVCAAGLVLLLFSKTAMRKANTNTNTGNTEGSARGQSSRSPGGRPDGPGDPAMSGQTMSGPARILLIILEAAILVVIAGAAFYVASHFSDDFGTNRGLIWRTGWEQFLEYPLKRKLTGIGPALLAIPYAKLAIDPGINVISAHCEPLNILLAQGIVGLGLYLLLWGRLLALWIRNRMWKDARTVWFFPLAAYFGHSLFCPLYPVTAALFSLTAGLFLRSASGVI